MPNCRDVAFEAKDCATTYEQLVVPWKINGKSTGELLLAMFVRAAPLIIKAACKWVEAKGKITPYAVSGFEVVGLSQGESKLLREFTRLLSLNCNIGDWSRVG